MHYANGDGVKQDLSKGRYWIHKAALTGYPFAQYNLGVMFLDGIGGSKSTSCAEYWLNKAAVVGGETGFMAKQLLDYVAEHNKQLAPKIIRPDSTSSCQQLPDIVFPALPGVSTAPLPGNSAPIKNNPPTVNDTLQGALSSNGGAEEAKTEASEPEQAKTAAPEPAQTVAEASEPKQAKTAVPETAQAVAEASEPEQAKTAVPEPAEAVVEESETAQAKEESQFDLEPATSYRKTVGRYLIQLGAKISGQEEEHSLTLSPPVKTEREIASREESEQAVEPMTVPEGHQDDNLLSKEFLKGSENNQKVDDLPLVIQIFELPLMHQSEPNTMEPPGTGPVDEEEALVLSESRKGLSDARAVNGAAITEGKSVSSSSDAENKSESTTVIPPVTEAPQALKTAPVPTAHAPLNLGGDIRHASKKHYTLQLGSASQSEPLLAMARKQKLSNYLVYETQRHGQRWFVLVHGEYATMSQAKRALQQLPASFKKDSPWARSIGHVQTEL
ncbi:SPOR domain-containing protein [Citrobacter sp. JGM124]|uniref:SPOR domain-containing protein n=1 Tax=Citrobacter sp. JGM124 TaxID=2799789 RepID=UPI001BA731D7|nr:SEL1-like repeat protein [Citrobacter sp. JGM124]